MKHFQIVAGAVLVLAFFGCGPKRVEIFPIPSNSKSAAYVREFVDTLKISTPMSPAGPMAETRFYLESAPPPLSSPDGRWVLREEKLRDYRHRVVLVERGTAVETTVVIFREVDPGSGKSYGLRWSADSEAVFVFGGGRPPGHGLKQDWALIYVIAENRLYEADLKEFLKTRVAQLKAAAVSKSKGVEAP